MIIWFVIIVSIVITVMCLFKREGFLVDNNIYDLLYIDDIEQEEYEQAYTRDGYARSEVNQSKVKQKVNKDNLADKTIVKSNEVSELLKNRKQSKTQPVKSSSNFKSDIGNNHTDMESNVLDLNLTGALNIK